MLKNYGVLFLLSCLTNTDMGLPLVPIETFGSINNAESRNISQEGHFSPRESFMHRKLEHERSPSLYFVKPDNNVDSNAVLSYCRRPAKCLPLSFNNHTSATCLGTKLPYSKTTLELIPGLYSLEEVQVS